MKGFFKNNRGIGTVEAIIIIVVIVGLLIFFKEKIIGAVSSIMAAI